MDQSSYLCDNKEDQQCEEKWLYLQQSCWIAYLLGRTFTASVWCHQVNSSDHAPCQVSFTAQTLALLTESDRDTIGRSEYKTHTGSSEKTHYPAQLAAAN